MVSTDSPRPSAPPPPSEAGPRRGAGAGARWGALALGLALLLSGCVEIDVHQKFYPDGHSEVVQQFYIPNLVASLDSSGLLPPAPYDQRPDGWGAMLNERCANASLAEPGASCEMYEGWMVVRQTREPGPEYTLTTYRQFPYIINDVAIYRLPRTPFPELEAVVAREGGVEGALAGARPEAVEEMQRAGVHYTYHIALTGDVFYRSAGSREADQTEVDALEQMRRGEPIRIKSRTLDTERVALVALLVLDVALMPLIPGVWLWREGQRRRRLARIREQRALEEEERRRGLRPDRRLKGNEEYMAPPSALRRKRLEIEWPDDE